MIFKEVLFNDFDSSFYLVLLQFTLIICLISSSFDNILILCWVRRNHLNIFITLNVQILNEDAEFLFSYTLQFLHWFEFLFHIIANVHSYAIKTSQFTDFY